MLKDSKHLGRWLAIRQGQSTPARRSVRKPLFLERLEPRFLLSSYSVVDLGFLPEAFSNHLLDINNAGQTVGYSGEHAVLWTPSTARDGTGAMTDLGLPMGYYFSMAKAISSDGRIAGVAAMYDGTADHPWVWSPGSTTVQVIDNTASGDALDVNSQGKVVGVRIVDSSEHAVVWESDGSGGYVATDLNSVFPPAEIPELPGSGTFWIHEAAAINDNNQIVANGLYMEDTNGDGYADVLQDWGFLLEDDDGCFNNGGLTVTDLGALGSRQYTFATDINNLGQIVGASAGPRNNQGWHAFLWQNEVMQDLGTLPKDVSSRALGISDTGLVVGYSEKGGGYYPHPFLWQNGRMTDLNTMIPADSGWTLRYVYAVNNQGEIVGSGEDPRDSGHYSWRGFLLSTSVTLPTISIGDASVTEGDSGTTAVQLEVTLSEPPGPGQTVSVDYYTTGCYNDSASPDMDFITAAGTVTFNEGQTSQVITVQVNGDLLAGVNADPSGNTDQGNEFFYVNLADPHNGAGVQTAVFLDAQGKVTILEDEPAMSISDVAYPEGNEGLTPFTFTVLLSVPAKDTVTVHWRTGDNTAKADQDYIAAEGDLVIPADASSGTFTVQVIGDKVKEDWEVFSVQLDKATVQNAHIPDLSNRTGGFAWGRIENDDRTTKPGKATKGSATRSIADVTGVALVAADPSDLLPNARERSGLPAAGRSVDWLDAASQASALIDGGGDRDLMLHFEMQATELNCIFTPLVTDDPGGDGILNSKHQTAVSRTSLTATDEYFQGFGELDLFLSGKHLRDLLEDLAAADLV